MYKPCSKRTKEMANERQDYKYIIFIMGGDSRCRQQQVFVINYNVILKTSDNCSYSLQSDPRPLLLSLTIMHFSSPCIYTIDLLRQKFRGLYVFRHFLLYLIFKYNVNVLWYAPRYLLYLYCMFCPFERGESLKKKFTW